MRRSSVCRAGPSRWARLFLCWLPVMAACNQSEPAPDLPNPDEEALGIVELGRLGGEIYNEPERAEEILDGAGLSAEEFEERVRRITNDPVLAREYSRGFEGVARPPLTDSVPDSLPVPDTGAVPDARDTTLVP